jgi:hypothetical protein
LHLGSNTWIGDVWAELAPPGVFPRLEALDVGYASWPVEGFLAWARADRPARLRELALPSAGGGDRSALGPALAGSPALASLERLTLAGNFLGPDLPRHLTAADWLPGLVQLDLGKTGVGDAGAEALARSDRPRRLRTLGLEGNPLTARGLRALAEASWASGLRVLDLREVRLGQEGAAALGWAPALAGLRELDVGYCSLDAQALEALLAGGSLRGLRRLNLNGNPLRGRGLDLLCDPSWLPHLRRLVVGHHTLDAPARARLRDALGDRVNVM